MKSDQSKQTKLSSKDSEIEEVNHLDNDKEDRELVLQIRNFGTYIATKHIDFKHKKKGTWGEFDVECKVLEEEFWNNIQAHTQSKLKAFAGEVEQAQRVIEAYIDDEECSFDHHGYCQTHNLNEVDQRCVNIVAKESVEALKAIKEKFDV